MSKHSRKIAGKEPDTPEEAGSLPPIGERYAHLRERCDDPEGPSRYEKIEALRPSRRQLLRVVLDADGPLTTREIRGRVEDGSKHPKQLRALAEKGILTVEGRQSGKGAGWVYALAESVDPERARDALDAENGGERV